MLQRGAVMIASSRLVHARVINYSRPNSLLLTPPFLPPSSKSNEGNESINTSLDIIDEITRPMYNMYIYTQEQEELVSCQIRRSERGPKRLVRNRNRDLISPPAFKPVSRVYGTYSIITVNLLYTQVQELPVEN